MNAIVAFSLLLLSVAAFAEPTQHRLSLVPDGEDHMNIMDLDPLDTQEPSPKFVPEEDILFILFTRSNPTVGQRITWTVDSITNSNWRTAALGTRFIIHGFAGSESAMVNVELRPAYLAAADYNVVVVDWGAGALDSAAENAPNAGAVIGRFIDWLHLNGFLVDFSRLHVACHSLGVHVAGFASRSITRGRIQTLFALDGGLPTNLENPVPDSFAVYVETISTSEPPGDGSLRAMGHANFYPNFGLSQPGCLTNLCSHMRVIGFMAESIISDRFVARPCSSLNQIETENCPPGQGAGAIMGGNANKVLNGIFYLETNPSSPFAQG